MAIALPTVTGATIVSEYAATNTNLTRSMQPDAYGHYQPVFGASLNYSRTDYLVDSEGNKTAIVQHVPVQPQPGLPWTPDPYQGNINLTPAQLATLEATVPTTGLLSAIAAQEDLLIQADLVARGIIQATA